MNQRTRLKRANAQRHPRQDRAEQKRLMREMSARYWENVFSDGFAGAHKKLQSEYVSAILKPLVNRYVGKALLNCRSAP